MKYRSLHPLLPLLVVASYMHAGEHLAVRHPVVEADPLRQAMNDPHQLYRPATVCRPQKAITRQEELLNQQHQVVSEIKKINETVLGAPSDSILNFNELNERSNLAKKLAGLVIENKALLERKKDELNKTEHDLREKVNPENQLDDLTAYLQALAGHYGDDQKIFNDKELYFPIDENGTQKLILLESYMPKQEDVSLLQWFSSFASSNKGKQQEHKPADVVKLKAIKKELEEIKQKSEKATNESKIAKTEQERATISQRKEKLLRRQRTLKENEKELIEQMKASLLNGMKRNEVNKHFNLLRKNKRNDIKKQEEYLNSLLVYCTPEYNSIQKKK